MIKVKDGYAKLIGTVYGGSSDNVLLSDGGTILIHRDRNNEANKLVKTDSNGYLQTGLINTTSSDLGASVITKIYCSNDDYIRYKTPANFFETFANDNNQVSITVGSQNRKLTIDYATNSNNAYKLDGNFESVYLRYRGYISPDYIDLEESIVGHADYQNPYTGIYAVNRGGHTELFVHFQAYGSVSGLQFLTSYSNSNRLKVRKNVDGNKVSGPWKELAWVSDIPTKTSQLVNDSGFITGGPYLPLSGGVLKGNVIWEPGYGNGTTLPGHIYRNTYGAENVYDHYYNSSTTATNTIANLRVKSDNSFKVLQFSGDGTFTWDDEEVLHSANFNRYSPKLDGTGATGTWDINISGDADTVDGKHAHEFATVNTLVYSTQRDFPDGTLITTDIDYSVESGNPFYGEIKGNTYGDIYTCNTQFQGYIWGGSLINYGVSHLTPIKISPITAMNINGNLCFWFPRLNYWHGYSIKITTGYDYSTNRVVKVENSAKPNGTKQVDLSSSERYVIHSGNIGQQSVSYANNTDTVDSHHASDFAFLKRWNDLLHNGSEFTFVSPQFSGNVWLNYRTSSGTTDGNITKYSFGNGKGGELAYISNGYFSGKAESANSAGTLNIIQANKPSECFSNQHIASYLISSTSTPSTPGYAGDSTGFPTVNNANSILWLGNHTGNYGGQLGISSDKRLYYRFIEDGSFPTSTGGSSWNRIAWSYEIPTTLPANGGNADTVDTYHADYFIHHKQYRTLSALPSGSEGWYKIANIKDSLGSPCVFMVRTYAHSSAIFTASLGYDWGSHDRGTITLLNFTESTNGSYANIKGARIISGGDVEILLTKPSQNSSTYIDISIGIYNADNVKSLDVLTLNSGSPTVITTRNFVNKAIMSDTFVGNLIGNADSATKLGSANFGNMYTPIYLNGGNPTVGTSYASAITSITKGDTNYAYTCVDGTSSTFDAIDTKNTAGAMPNANKKLFLIGAPSIGTNPITFTNSKVYITDENTLHSNGATYGGTVTNDISTYYTYPIKETLSSVGTSSSSSNYIYRNADITNNCLLFFGSDLDSEELRPVYIHGSLQYYQVTIPAGKILEATITFNSTGLKLGTNGGGVLVYGVTVENAQRVFYCEVSSTAQSTSYVEGPNALEYSYLSLPRLNTSTSSTTILRYHNESSTSKSVYIRAGVRQSGTTLRHIYNTSGSAEATSGSYTIGFKASVSNIKFNTPRQACSYPNGKTAHYGNNGYVLVDPDAGNVDISLPSIFFIKRGNYCLRLMNGFREFSINEGETWTTYS